ncbi:MAG: Fur family transcriptional regulator [Aminipila sp.]
MKSRNTIQKNIILKTVCNIKKHPSAEEIYLEVAKENPTISRATVYRNLKKMAEKGELLRIEIPNSSDKYDFYTENHYHIKCNKCGRVYDVEVPDLNVLDMVEDKNFKITGYDLVFKGYCKVCREGDTNG